MISAYARGLVPLLVMLTAAVSAGPSLQVPSRRLTGAEAYRQARAATAWVQAADQGKGTGWVLDRSRRLLVTCYHVVGENETVEVIFPVRLPGAILSERAYYVENLPALRREGRSVRGRVLRRDRDRDLALVELAALPPGVGELHLAAAPARPGDRAHVVGNRYDTDALWLYTGGAVRQVRTLREGYFNGGRQLARGARVVVAQAPINEGDSGAALVNERGEVIGVAAAIAWEEHGVGLFIDAREVRALAGSLLPAMPNPASEGPPGPHELYRRGLRSLAVVQPFTADRRASGLVLDRARRLLLTTSDGVGKEKTVTVLFPVHQEGRPVAEVAWYRDQQALLRKKGVLVEGTVLAADARRNLALLELTALPPGVEEVTFGVTAPSPGDPLHALGNPRRGEALWVYTAAAVRQLGHANLGQTNEGPDPAVVIVQGPFAEGEGGDPLLDKRGAVAAIASGKAEPQQQVAYALPPDEVHAFLTEARPRWSPRDAAGLCRRAEVFLEARRYDRARRDFAEALHLDPGCAPAYAGRARVRLLQGDADGALADSGQALRIDPRLVAGYYARAAGWCVKGEPAKAVADCDAALRLERGCALAHALRGRARLLQGDADRAIADCDEAIWLDRRLPEALLYRGQAHARKGDSERAIADYTLALALDPRRPEVYRSRGDAQWAKSDVAAALADFEQALTLDPHDARALHGRGRALAARGVSDRALADFTAALRCDPRRAAAWLDRGSERLRRGELEAALEDYRQALTRQPQCAADILDTVAYRAAQLLEGDRADPAACADLCRRVLRMLRPFVQDRPEVVKLIDIARAAREPDPQRQARALRAIILSIRAKLRPGTP